MRTPIQIGYRESHQQQAAALDNDPKDIRGYLILDIETSQQVS